MLALWVIGFGVGTLRAVLFLAGAWHPRASAPTASSALTAAAEDVLTGAGVVWLVVLLARTRGLRSADLGWRPTWGRHWLYRRQAVTVGALYLSGIASAALVCGWLIEHVGGNSYPFDPPGLWGLLPAVTSSINAGVVEELVLVGFLVTVLRQARQRLEVILLVGLALRWSFHVYYGPASLWVLAWGTIAVGLYWWTRRLTPLILTHALWDLLGSTSAALGPSGAQTVTLIVELLVLVLEVGLVAYLTVQGAQYLRRRRHPKAAAAAT